MLRTIVTVVLVAALAVCGIMLIAPGVMSTMFKSQTALGAHTDMCPGVLQTVTLGDTDEVIAEGAECNAAWKLLKGPILVTSEDGQTEEFKTARPWPWKANLWRAPEGKTAKVVVAFCPPETGWTSTKGCQPTRSASTPRRRVPTTDSPGTRSANL